MTRPSLQTDVGAGRCGRVAVPGFVRNTVDACDGIRASSWDSVYAMPVVHVSGCPCNPGRAGAWPDAIAAAARTDTRVPRNSIVLGLENAAETIGRMLHSAYFPWQLSANKPRGSLRECIS